MKRGITLQNEARQFPPMAALVQDDSAGQATRDARLAALKALYLTWYRNGLALIAAHGRIDLQHKFTRYYQGWWIMPAIRFFLTHGAKPYVYRGKFKVAPEWTSDRAKQFDQSLTEQINVLAALGE